MVIILHLLLLLRAGQCTDDLIFETKTVDVGDDVKLTCPRQTLDHNTKLFWIRLVSGNLPEFLGGTYSFDFDRVNKIPRITAEQEPETFVLRISETDLSDTGLYYCMKVDVLHMTFLTGTFLKIKEPEPDITAVTEVPPSDPVRPGDSVTIQCSVLSDPDKKSCPGDHSVYWFRAGSDESHPRLIYAHGNSSDQCERSPEAQTTQKCVYNFSMTISSSDAGTHYCAVASCGQILIGGGTKFDIEGLNTGELQKYNVVLFVLCAALALSLIVIAVLIYFIKKKTCECCKVSGQTYATTASGHQQRQQRDEDSLAYAAPTFNKRKAGKTQRAAEKTAERETVYTGVRAL